LAAFVVEAVGAGAGGGALASVVSGGGPFGLKGCCVGGLSTVVSGAGYLAACRAPVGGASSRVQAETKNAMSSASDSHNFIIFLDEVYTASISMPVASESQLILQKPNIGRFPYLLQQWSQPRKF
jgi:hypothetical protein